MSRYEVVYKAAPPNPLVDLYLLEYIPTGEYLFVRIALNRTLGTTRSEAMTDVINERIRYLRSLAKQDGNNYANKPMSVFSIRARGRLRPNDFKIRYVGTYQKTVEGKVNPKIKQAQLEIVNELGTDKLLSAHVIPRKNWNHPYNKLSNDDIQKLKRTLHYSRL